MVSSHVESHAASSLSQRVIADGADDPQQGLRTGEGEKQIASLVTRVHASQTNTYVLLHVFLFFG